MFNFNLSVKIYRSIANDIILIKQKIYGKKADLVLICEKKGILIINICNRFLTKSDVFDDVNEDNELEENDINPIEDENNIFIKRHRRNTS